MIKKVFKAIKDGTFFEKVETKLKLKKLKKFKGTDEEYLTLCCKLFLKYDVDLRNPKTFNEWINWYKLNYKNDLMPICVDKVKVDEYVSSKGLSDILVKKYEIWDSPSQININKLPNSFVIKTNHDSGGVCVCKSKLHYNKNMQKKLKKAFKKDFSNLFREWPYAKVEKKIFAEEYLSENNKIPCDYKFFCFNGEPKFLYVCTGRGVKTCFDFFDLEWNHLNIVQHYPNSNNTILKPKNFDRMLDVARILSKDFPFVRVDLYNIDGQIKFGELTFYHFAGITPFETKDMDLELGKFFIDNIKC